MVDIGNICTVIEYYLGIENKIKTYQYLLSSII